MFSFLDNAYIYLAMNFKCSINIESNIILIANSKSDSNFNKSDSKSFLIESISSKANNDTSNKSQNSTETNEKNLITASSINQVPQVSSSHDNNLTINQDESTNGNKLIGPSPVPVDSNDGEATPHTTGK